MNQTALQKQIDTLQKELTLMGEYCKNSFLDLKEELDRLGLEVSALRAFLEEAYPELPARYQEIFDKTVQNTDKK